MYRDPWANRDDVPSINANQIGRPTYRPPAAPKVDPDVSAIVGKPILVNDFRLVKLIMKWRNQKDPNQPDNFLKDREKIEELKQVFNETN